MASPLDSLTQGSPPPYLDGNQAIQRTLPDWYNQYIQGIAGKATQIAARPYQPYPGQRLADFNQDQTGAFQGVRGNQGSWSPYISQAGGTLDSVVPQTQGALSQAGQYARGATGAVSGPSQNWTDPGTAQSYMSPYTSSVVNEIGRLGNQNFNENIAPAITQDFIGSGQFGSTRNGDMLGRAARDTQSNISGLQSAALQSGYGVGAGIFGQDANRQQQQQQMQAQSQLGAGSLATSGAQVGANAGLSTAQGQGALGSLRSQLGYGDATSLAGIGQQQQNLEQTGYDTGYNEFLNQRNWDWNQLGQVQGAVNGAQLPTGATSSTSSPAPGAGYGGSPLQWLTAIGGVAGSGLFGGPS